MTQPIDVLVFGAVNDVTLPAPFLELSRQHAQTVTAALAGAGMAADVVDTAEGVPDLDALRSRARHGLVLLGGGDVDPTLYGHDEPVDSLYGVNREVDLVALQLIRSTLEVDVPILAICRGAQLVNVARGGTLVPDIAAWTPHRGATADTIFVHEPVTLAEDSELARIMGRTELDVLNGHHQAIDRPGDGVRITARAQDGIAEAIEVEDRWLVGVQWHPEHADADPQDRKALFGAFGAAVASHHERGAR